MNVVGAKVCPTCGQKIVTYRHRLNRVLISALRKLQDHDGVGKISDLGLTNSEFANMQKLKYFGLVDKVGSSYVLNEFGKSFLQGKAKAPSVVFTKHGIVVGTEELVSIDDVKCIVQDKDNWRKQVAGI